MKKIELTFVSHGSPAVAVNGEYLDTKDGPLSVLHKEISRVVKTTAGFQVVKGITAWGGEIISHETSNPAEDMREIASFKDIIVHEADENTRDHEFIEKIRPILVFLAWHKSAHFRQIDATVNFKCLVCGRKHLGHGSVRLGFSPPVCCDSAKCYSHTVSLILQDRQ